MKDREFYAQRAKENFKSGYNCCQAVLLAFQDELDIDIDNLARIASGFGAGMGKLREVCGAVSGMNMVASLKLGYVEAGDLEKKAEIYAIIHSLADEFKKETGSIICRDLLKMQDDGSTVPAERTAEYYKKRPCAELCELAARLVAQKINEKM